MNNAYMTAAGAAVGAVIVLVGGIRSGIAEATPAEGEIVRTEIAMSTTDAPIAIVAVGQETTFYVQNLVLKPASSSGWHTHSGPEYTVIKKGTVCPTGTELRTRRLQRGRRRVHPGRHTARGVEP